MYQIVGKDCFIKGAEYQEKQNEDKVFSKHQIDLIKMFYEKQIAKMYAYEEVLSLLKSYSDANWKYNNIRFDVTEWMEQNKK